MYSFTHEYHNYYRRFNDGRYGFNYVGSELICNIPKESWQMLKYNCANLHTENNLIQIVRRTEGYFEIRKFQTLKAETIFEAKLTSTPCLRRQTSP